jgi:hypothetical protein
MSVTCTAWCRPASEKLSWAHGPSTGQPKQLQSANDDKQTWWYRSMQITPQFQHQDTSSECTSRPCTADAACPDLTCRPARTAACCTTSGSSPDWVMAPEQLQVISRPPRRTTLSASSFSCRYLMAARCQQEHRRADMASSNSQAKHWSCEYLSCNMADGMHVRPHHNSGIAGSMSPAGPWPSHPITCWPLAPRSP